MRVECFNNSIRFDRFLDIEQIRFGPRLRVERRIDPSVSACRVPPLILQPDALGWVTMAPDATNQGFSGPLLRLHSEAISPGGIPPTAGPGNPVTGANQKSGLDFEISFEAEPTSGPSLSGPTLGNSLDRIHINNWLEDAEFDLTQLNVDACSPITWTPSNFRSSRANTSFRKPILSPMILPRGFWS